MSVEISREKPDRFVLKDEIGQAVEDRLATIDLDAAKNMRTVSHKDVGPGVHHGVGERHQEFGGHLAGLCAFVAVARHDDPIRLPARLLDGPHYLGQIAFVRSRVASRRVARSELLAEEAHAFTPSSHSKTHLLAHLSKLLKRTGAHGVDGPVANGTEARSATDVRSLRAGAILI